MIIARLKDFLRDRRAVSAVEFGFIAPILAIVVIGTTEAGAITYRYYDMDAAVGSGAQYVLRGGTDTAVIQAVVSSAWTKQTSDAKVAIDQFCRCAAKIALCTSTCPDASTPLGFMTIRASETYKGLWMSKAISASETVRVQWVEVTPAPASAGLPLRQRWGERDRVCHALAGASRAAVRHHRVRLGLSLQRERASRRDP